MASNQPLLTIKAYYNDLAESQPEIRRFSIEFSSSTDSYRILETTIAQLNSNYVPGQFTLQYIDEDNDRITFSSDVEFRSAVQQLQSGSVMKVFVKPKAKENEPKSSKTDEALHPFVTCDGCQGSVIGNRYKCMQCPDYDLCQACKDKNIHSEHNMITIARPQRFGSCNFGRRCGRGPWAGGRFGGAGRFWRQFVQQQQNSQENPNGAGFQFPPDMVNFLSRYTGKELAELVEAHLPEYLRTAAISQMLNDLKTGEHADKTLDHKILLEHVGKFLREVLSPFGIDCDYFVDGNSSNQPTTGTGNAKETPEECRPDVSSTASSSTESKPTSTENTQSTSGFPNASVPPSFGNLLGQLQTMFNPMFHQQSTSSNGSASSAAATNEQQNHDEQQKIQDCVDRMTAMGFVDSNGVLTELIKAKKGDINQVLDALNPRNYQS